ncbi:MAG: serine hydrolase [Bacteroidota bacterium]
MISRTLFLLVLTLFTKPLFSQNLDTAKLNKFFDQLEERQEAMGSITISKNKQVIYSKSIGFRYADRGEKIEADTETNYRIWSITKLYTATMIMQLVEEGRLSLNTKLMDFYPQISNAASITIKDMLNHRSGIHDFIQNDGPEDWDANIREPLTENFMVNHIAQYPPDFQPNEGFRYSNSNYLLLGYIIEKLDGNPYETSLYNRISAKLGMTSTYFGIGALDTIENKAHSYRYLNKEWVAVDEGPFSGLIPAAAGGIVSTSSDMNLFIEGLFSGKLVSQKSLNIMLPKNEFYGLGVMQTTFSDSKIGYGHTGGFTASESSLFYYPQDSVSIAYATNGIVIRKEKILENVLKVYHKQPFDVSMDRKLQVLFIFGLGAIIFLLLKVGFPGFVAPQHLLYLGYIIPIVFWIGAFIAGHLHGNHSFIKDDITNLDAFYSSSGTFMAGIQITISFLLIPYIYSLFKYCSRLKIHLSPLIPLCILPISFLGVALFPFPDVRYQFFINAILIVILGPLLATFLWRKGALAKLRWQSFFCLLIMLIAMLLVIGRPAIPEFVHSYWGLIQRALYLGWTLWLFFLSRYLLKSTRKRGNNKVE